MRAIIGRQLRLAILIPFRVIELSTVIKLSTGSLVLSGKRVFVIDDDPSVLNSVKVLLSASGYSVECYADPERFLEGVLEEQQGCVITDLKMPNMSGIQLQDELLRRKSTLAVIVVTGYADVPSTVKIMEGGAVTLLEKPYNATAMITAVERALGISEDSYNHRQKVKDAIRRISLLDEEEIEVMECIIKEMPVKAISDSLSISSRTVDRRKQSAFIKTEAESVAHFAAMLTLARANWHLFAPGRI